MKIDLPDDLVRYYQDAVRVYDELSKEAPTLEKEFRARTPENSDELWKRRGLLGVKAEKIRAEKNMYYGEILILLEQAIAPK